VHETAFSGDGERVVDVERCLEQRDDVGRRSEAVSGAHPRRRTQSHLHRHRNCRRRRQPVRPRRLRLVHQNHRQGNGDCKY